MFTIIADCITYFYLLYAFLLIIVIAKELIPCMFLPLSCTVKASITKLITIKLFSASFKPSFLPRNENCLYLKRCLNGLCCVSTYYYYFTPKYAAFISCITTLYNILVVLLFMFQTLYNLIAELEILYPEIHSKTSIIYS